MLIETHCILPASHNYLEYISMQYYILTDLPNGAVNKLGQLELHLLPAIKPECLEKSFNFIGPFCTKVIQRNYIILRVFILITSLSSTKMNIKFGKANTSGSILLTNLFFTLFLECYLIQPLQEITIITPTEVEHILFHSPKAIISCQYVESDLPYI